MDKLQYLLISVTPVYLSAWQIQLNTSLFFFINVANMTLARHDAYLVYVKTGIKHATLISLRQTMLFPDHILIKAVEDIAQYENKGHSTSSSQKTGHCYLYDRPEKSKDYKSGKPAWKTNWIL